MTVRVIRIVILTRSRSHDFIFSPISRLKLKRKPKQCKHYIHCVRAGVISAGILFNRYKCLASHVLDVVITFRHNQNAFGIAQQHSQHVQLKHRLAI